MEHTQADSYTGQFLVPLHSDNKDLLPKKPLLMIKELQSVEKKDFKHLQWLPYYLENIFLQWLSLSISKERIYSEVQKDLEFLQGSFHSV